MVEYGLLLLVGKVISTVVNIGYVVAGGYFVKTGIIYVKDYKEAGKNW